MKYALAILLLCLTLYCTHKPPIYITSKCFIDISTLKNADFEVLGLQNLELNDFKRAFVKKYGDENEFKKSFTNTISSMFKSENVSDPKAFKLELLKLNVDNHVESFIYMVSGGPNTPSHMQTSSTEYCAIKLDFIIKSSKGIIVMDGQVTEKTAKGEFLHPNQSKLANAIAGIQQHLVDYIRGRMSSENISSINQPNA